MISNTQNAAFTGISILFCTILAHYIFPGEHYAGFMLIGLLAVVGVNAKGTVGNRIRLSVVAAAIMLVISLLAKLTEQRLVYVLIGSVFVAFILAYCRRVFPYNWADISLPAGASYVMLVPHSHAWPVTFYAFYGIALGLFLALLFVFLYLIKKSYINNRVEIPKEKTVYYNFDNIWILPKDLFYFGIELALLLVLSISISEGIKITFPHAYWMPLTVIVVLQVKYQQTKERVWHRLFGTLLGCSLGSILLMIHLPGWFLLFSPSICLFLFLYLAPKKYYLAVIFMTLFVLIFIAIPSPEPLSVMMERLIFSVLGAFICLFSAWIFKKLAIQ